MREKGETVWGDRQDVASSVSERVDTDDTIVAFTPRVSPHVQPLANASSESSTGCTASGVLCSGVLFLSNDSVSCEKRKCQVVGPTSDGKTTAE